ncbi:MAG: DPP IV N-terminal domain-containing protein, partial [Calditrichota bacterium]
MKTPLYILMPILLILLIPFKSNAQDKTDELTLERIYKENDFRLNRFGPARWLEDGSGYTTLERSAKFPKARDIIKYTPEKGKRTILVNAERLVPQGKDAPLPIKDYHWSADGKKLLIFTNTERVWRYETRGDYWVLDLASGKLSKLGQFAKPSTMMFAKFSPDGNSVGYVVENNIFVEDIKSATIVSLTEDGSSRYINGTFDWVYEEELSCRDGFRWSPDSKHIAYWHSDTEGTGVFYLINNLDSIYSQPIPFPYPKVGTTNSAVKVGVVPVTGGETKWFDVPGDPRNNYLARMEFIPSSSEVMIQQLNRLQNTNTVWVGDI